MGGQSRDASFYSAGSSRGVSKPSNQTWGSHRGQSLISRGQSGKQSNQIRARRSAQTSSSRRRRADSRFSSRNTARRPNSLSTLVEWRVKVRDRSYSAVLLAVAQSLQTKLRVLIGTKFNSTRTEWETVKPTSNARRGASN